MSEQIVLVQTKDNWADEMDIYGWRICAKHWLDAYLETAKRYFESGGEPIIEWVGTNEEIYYNNYSDITRILTIKEINEKEVEMIKKLFGSDYGGDTPSLNLDFD